MNRREFLNKTGKFLIAGSLTSLTGCNAMLNLLPAQEIPAKLGKLNITSNYPHLSVVKGSNPAINVIKALEKLGGIKRFVKKGNKVIIKPNLLTAREPQFATTTNPEVIHTLVKLCLAAGASEVTVLDNPTSNPKITYEVAGIAKATTAAGGKIKILTSRNFVNYSIPKAKVLKKWSLVKDIFSADVFINVPIAKSHGLAKLTMSMKNLMGIMGGFRQLVHQNFEQKIVDLNTAVKPNLVILDAYRILVKNGPTGGNLADVKLAKTVVVGTSQVAVDAFGATLFGLKPTEITYLHKAYQQGLGEINLNKLKIVKQQFA